MIAIVKGTRLAKRESTTPDAGLEDGEVLRRSVHHQLGLLLKASREESFEPGVDSRFAQDLEQLWRRYPTEVLAGIKRKFENQELGAELGAEVVRWLSRQDGEEVRDAVVEILRSALHHRSPLVRDSAASGLAWLLEGEAVGPIQKTLEREEVPELRRDLQDLVAWLKR